MNHRVTQPSKSGITILALAFALMVGIACGGSDGEIGPPGPAGVQGKIGAVGPPGSTGLQGFPGVAGPEGPRGTKGLTGASGEDGKSGVLAIGVGLTTVGAIEGDVASVDFDGTGEANTSARSDHDHDHDDDYYTALELTAGTAEVAWESITGVPEDLSSGGAASSVEWDDIAGRPSGLDDGDDFLETIEWNKILNRPATLNTTLGGMACGSSEIAIFNGSTWVCGDTGPSIGDYAISSQSCVAGLIATGIDATGNLVCATLSSSDTVPFQRAKHVITALATGPGDTGLWNSVTIDDDGFPVIASSKQRAISCEVR